MRDRPFETVDELDAYVGGPRIQCLECDQWFKSLATHLPRAHGMTHADYREKWAIPKRYALAGTATREALSQQIREQIDSGRLDHSHLSRATDAARDAPRVRKMPADDAAHRQRVAEHRPGDHHRLPEGANTADGRNAERRRLNQQVRRARAAGDQDSLREARWRLTILNLRRELGPTARELKGERAQYRLMEHEREFMRKHYAEHGPAILSEVLDRHYGTINAAAWRMGLRSNSPQGNQQGFRWKTEVHDDQLKAAHEAGKTLGQIALHIGTSVNTVRAHAKRLSLTFPRGRRPRHADHQE